MEPTQELQPSLIGCPQVFKDLFFLCFKKVFFLKKLILFLFFLINIFRLFWYIDIKNNFLNIF